MEVIFALPELSVEVTLRLVKALMCLHLFHRLFGPAKKTFCLCFSPHLSFTTSLKQANMSGLWYLDRIPNSSVSSLDPPSSSGSGTSRRTPPFSFSAIVYVGETKLFEVGPRVPPQTGAASTRVTPSSVFLSSPPYRTVI